MTHRLVATIEFDFQGRHYAPSVELDVEDQMERCGCLPDIYALLARTAGIDDYSYEIDIMLMEPISYSAATGLIAHYIDDDGLDIDGFNAAWHSQRRDRLLGEIAERCRRQDTDNREEALKIALKEAYELGSDDAQREYRLRTATQINNPY